MSIYLDILKIDIIRINLLINSFFEVDSYIIKNALLKSIVINNHPSR